MQGELIKLQDWVERTGAKVAVIFDRFWYNRSGVERVMGFATPEQIEQSAPRSAFHDIGVGAHEAILPQPVGTRLIGTVMPAIGDDRAIAAG